MKKTPVVFAALLQVLYVSWQASAQTDCTAASRAGRYADTSDPTCRTYTLCVLNAANNSFLTYNYVCPTTTVFNRITNLCTSPANYQCPSPSTTTTTAATTTSTTTTNTSTTTPAASPTTTLSPTTSSTTTTTTTPAPAS